MEIIEVKEEKDLEGLKKLQKIKYTCRNCGKEVIRVFVRNRIKIISRFLCRKCNTEKNNLEKYGYKNVAQIPEVKEKIANTNLERYGNKCSLNGEEQIKKKIETWKNNFGKSNPFQKEEVVEKVKENNLEKYGCEYAITKFNDKAHQAQLEKYGQYLHKHRYKLDNLYFDSWWEVCFYIKNKDEGKNILRENKVLEYFINGKKHLYYPDFEIDGILYEIKCDYWISKTNIEKLRCMKFNNVILISNNEIKEYLKYVKEKYPELKRLTLI